MSARLTRVGVTASLLFEFSELEEVQLEECSDAPNFVLITVLPRRGAELAGLAERVREAVQGLVLVGVHVGRVRVLEPR